MLEEGIVAMLNADARITAIVPPGGGGFLGTLPKDQALPSWSYLFFGAVPNLGLQTPTGLAKISMQIESYGQQRADAINLAQALYEVLNGFQGTLSDRSVYLRYFHMQKLSSRVAHERLLRKCFIDYDREMALVADGVDPASGEHEIMAMGRLTRMHGSREAEVAVLVADRFQHCGLGSELLGRLIQVARDEQLERVTAMILLENLAMRALASRYGFEVVKDADLSLIRAVLTL